MRQWFVDSAKELKKFPKTAFGQKLFFALVGLLVAAGIFFSGYFFGQLKLKKTQFCFLPERLPLPLRRVFQESLGKDFLRYWQGRILVGKVKEINLGKLILITSAGERSLKLTPQTRYFRGRRPIRKVEIQERQRVVVLLDKEKKQALIIFAL